jgi:S1-C subfamily serine protease
MPNGQIREEPAMRNKIFAAVTMTFVLAAAVLNSSGRAQENSAGDAARAERQAAERQVEQEQLRAREGMERELAAARRELEQAAREVARLSAQATNPFVKDMERSFRYRSQRSMLGIGIEDTERGVRVASVSPNGPGARAGLQIGETIVAIDGAQLADPRVTGVGKQSPSELLLAQMANVDPGESVALRVLAESGSERDVTVQATAVSPFVLLQPGWRGGPEVSTLQFNSPGPWTAWNGFFRSSAWSDMQLVALTPELGAYFGSTKGLLVVRGPGSDALRLQDGDVILDIGGREPTTPEHAVRILSSFQEGETLRIAVMRKQRRETLEFQMPADSAD